MKSPTLLYMFYFVFEGVPAIIILLGSFFLQRQRNSDFTVAMTESKPPESDSHLVMVTNTPTDTPVPVTQSSIKCFTVGVGSRRSRVAVRRRKSSSQPAGDNKLAVIPDIPLNATNDANAKFTDQANKICYEKRAYAKLGYFTRVFQR